MTWSPSAKLNVSLTLTVVPSTTNLSLSIAKLAVSSLQGQLMITRRPTLVKRSKTALGSKTISVGAEFCAGVLSSLSSSLLHEARPSDKRTAKAIFDLECCNIVFIVILRVFILATSINTLNENHIIYIIICIFVLMIILNYVCVVKLFVDKHIFHS